MSKGRTELVCWRERNALVPRDPYSAELLDALAPRADVVVSIFQNRNPKHHKLLFALLKKVSENDPRGRSVEALLRDLKVANGMVTPILREAVDVKTGEVRVQTFYVLDSVSFAAMGQERFKRTFDAFMHTITTEILPGTGNDALLAEVAEASS